MPKVSVCIPAYSQVKYLKRTIDSVLLQSFTDYEIVITDDSPGNIVKELIEEYNLPGKIIYFKNPVSLGSPENWNEAIRKSTGDYIKILHHDDWLHDENSLKKYVQLLDESPEIDFAFSATMAVLPGGESWVHSISELEFDELAKHPLLLYNNNVIGAPSTTIVRRNSELSFDRNLKWLVDKEYYIRQLRNNCTMAYSRDVLVVTYLAEGRVTEECINNKQVEVFEYNYLLDKIAPFKNLYPKGDFSNCLARAMGICDKYAVKNNADIRSCGYHGKIHWSLSFYFAINSVSSLLGNLFKKYVSTV